MKLATAQFAPARGAIISTSPDRRLTSRSKVAYSSNPSPTCYPRQQTLPDAWDLFDILKIPLEIESLPSADIAQITHFKGLLQILRLVP